MNNAFDLALYFSVVALSCMCLRLALSVSSTQKAMRRGILLLAWVIPGVFYSLKYTTLENADYGRYIELSQGVAELSLDEYLTLDTPYKLESSFWLLARLSWRLTSGPYLIFAAYYLLTVACFLLGICALRNLSAIQKSSLWMFVLLTVIPFGLSGARALLATSLVFFAAVKIFQGRYVQFVALSAVAAFFHASSLVASVIVFLAAVSTSRKTHRLSRSLLACLALGVGGVGLASQLTYGTLFGLLNRIPLLGKYTAYESVIDPDSAIPSLSAVLPYVAAQTGAKALLLLFVVALCLSHEKEDYFIDSPTLRLLVLSSLAIAFTLVSAFARIGQLLYPLLGVCLYCLPKRRSHDEAKISPIDLTLAAYSITYFCAFVLIANWTGFFPFSFIWEHD